MAWLRKVPRSPYYQAIFNLPDGRKTTRSTRCKKRREAQQIADQFENASLAGKKGNLTEKQARKTLSDIFAIANQDELQSSSVEDYLHNWLQRKELEKLVESLKSTGVPDTIAYLTEDEVLGVEGKLEELGYNRATLRAVLHAPPQPVDYFHFFFRPLHKT